jgi:hypothetical protein
MKKLAPICLFTFDRLEETIKTVEALKKNHLASSSELYVFSDGAKNESSEKKVLEVRKYLQTINIFKKVTIYEAKDNKGLANSIIAGVSQVIERYGRVIVLEDDLVTSPNFLDFMNESLNFYEKNDKIFSISGYTFNLPSLENYPKDYYLGVRASSWGWGTWQDKWEDVDWEVKSYKIFRNSVSQQLKFMKGGSDMPRMLRRQMNADIDSWAIRWCYHQFLNDKLTVFPTTSKIKSIGFGDNATHTSGKEKQFDTFLDKGQKKNFSFDKFIVIDEQLLKEFKSKFSVKKRILSKFGF